MELTREQKKIIYIAALVAAFLMFFWIFIYIPQSRKLKEIQHKLSITEGEISDINRITGGMPEAEAVQGLNNKLNQMIAGFGDSDDDIIDALSKAARELKITINNISLSSRQLINSQIPGYEVREMPVSLKLTAEYRPLGEFLYRIRDNFPVLLTVRNLSISGEGEGDPRLDVDLEISAYLLSPASGQ